MRKNRKATKASNRMINSRSDESQLFADGREDEVRVLLGHVAEVRLESLEESRAVEPAGTNRVLGVVDVVDVLRPLRAGRVLVQEAFEPVDRVASDEVQVERSDHPDRTENRQQRQQSRWHSGHDQHGPDAQDQDDRGAQVGLDDDEQQGHARHNQQSGDVVHRESVGSSLTERRDGQDQDQHGELTGLNLEDADAVPPQGALGRRADDVDTDQSEQAAHVERGGHDLQASVVDE